MKDLDRGIAAPLNGWWWMLLGLIIEKNRQRHWVFNKRNKSKNKKKFEKRKKEL